MKSTTIALSLLGTLAAPTAFAGEPSADEILRRADAILAPSEFEGTVTFTTRRGNSAPRVMTLRVLKKGADLLRVRFLAPADDRGQELLRIGDDIWSYMPNLRRSLRVSSKQEFHGGDFSNADVLRVNLTQDYVPTLTAGAPADEWRLDLKAKRDDLPYARIVFFVRKADSMPLRQEFYTDSGKLIRKLEMSDPKPTGKLMRPTRYVMKNVLTPSRESEMVWDKFVVKGGLAADLFEVAALGR